MNNDVINEIKMKEEMVSILEQAINENDITKKIETVLNVYVKNSVRAMLDKGINERINGLKYIIKELKIIGEEK